MSATDDAMNADANADTAMTDGPPPVERDAVVGTAATCEDDDDVDDDVELVVDGSVVVVGAAVVVVGAAAVVGGGAWTVGDVIVNGPAAVFGEPSTTIL